ncbi:hypothetical protein LR48_Vigan10g262300 [Vigna angularis]|uniref:Uncharacterized protein n=1 Tax=Phaseolus angularis TaxID=3914 RepID=A0A0L9VNT4_PHAAN|nr:hypothetical protein LR48_Vigan10g262300 [Vigna angularis]
MEFCCKNLKGEVESSGTGKETLVLQVLGEIDSRFKEVFKRKSGKEGMKMEFLGFLEIWCVSAEFCRTHVHPHSARSVSGRPKYPERSVYLELSVIDIGSFN